MSRLRKVLDPSKTGKDAEGLEKKLLKLIVGQDEAIEQIVNIYQIHVTGMSAPKRPVGNFLFLGPTGSGQTWTKAPVGNPQAMIKIDCAEFQHSHELAHADASHNGRNSRGCSLADHFAIPIKKGLLERKRNRKQM